MIEAVAKCRIVLMAVAIVVLPTACSPAEPAPPRRPPSAGEFAPRRLSEPLPPPAEPAPARPLTATPAGRLVAVGSAPEGIVADPVTRTVAVGVRDPARLTLLNADSGTVSRQVPLPGVLRHLQLAGPGGPVLVPDESSNSLLQIGLPDGAVLARVPTGVSPHDANEAANGTIFVANEGGGSAVAVRGNSVVKTFTDVTQPAGVTHAGNIVGLLDVRENTLTFYDAATLTPITELAAGDGPTHVVTDRHGRMIVADTRGDALLVYQPPPRAAQLTRTALPGTPYGIAYDPVRDRLWVTLTAANQVVAYDMSRPAPREVERLATAAQPYTVAVDPTTGRLFVTATGQGSVEIIDP
ncbi:MAG TPA: YncE family protein [Pseudonocardia sp.]|jgi:DNA-binding beta-propeller fold protein YncE|nr:YncE family protein [Pseudonocardia sp.]